MTLEIICLIMFICIFEKMRSQNNKLRQELLDAESDRSQTIEKLKGFKEEIERIEAEMDELEFKNEHLQSRINLQNKDK